MVKRSFPFPNRQKCSRFGKTSVARQGRVKSSNDAIGSFVWACHQIDQEPNTIRKAILATPFAREAPNKYWDKQRHFLRLNKRENTAKKREEAAREKAA